MDRTSRQGLFTAGGNRKPALPTVLTDHREDYEEKYAKPKGFVVVNRSFLHETSKAVEQVATRNLPNNASPEDITDMIAFMEEAKTLINSKCEMKLLARILNAAKDLKIAYPNGQIIQTEKDLARIWVKHLDKDLLKKYFIVYYTSFEGEEGKEVVAKIAYDVKQELGIWHSTRPSSP